MLSPSYGMIGTVTSFIIISFNTYEGESKKVLA